MFTPCQVGDARDSITILSSSARRALQASLVLGVRRSPPPSVVGKPEKDESEGTWPSGESRGEPRGGPGSELRGVATMDSEQAAVLHKEEAQQGKQGTQNGKEHVQRKGLWKRLVGRLRSCLERRAGCRAAQPQGGPQVGDLADGCSPPCCQSYVLH